MLPEGPIQTVSVKAPARLHFGFLDMHGGLGRNFGSLGLCVSNITTHLEVKKSDSVVVHGASNQHIADCARRILDRLRINGGAEIVIHDAIPEHIGLGSGTQQALAVSTAIAILYRHQKSTSELAVLMGRGTRSGIGVGAFMQGGFLIDGGKGDTNAVPPIVTHCQFPKAWRVLLVFDNEKKGINGDAEKVIFSALPPMEADVSAYICRLTLMQLLPALATQDCDTFGSAITQIQTRVGQYFSNAQQGYYSSRQVADCLRWMLSNGATGIGQSSWGPTGFAIYPNEDVATQVLDAAHKRWPRKKNLDFYLSTIHNVAAQIKVNDQRVNAIDLSSLTNKK